MKILQVKQYNDEIASRKYQASDKTKTVPSMFFFYLDDEYNRRHGFNVARKRGYVAFNNTKAVYGKNEQEAITRFNS